MEGKFPKIATPKQQKQVVSNVVHATINGFAQGVDDMQKHKVMPFGKKPRY